MTDPATSAATDADPPVPSATEDAATRRSRFGLVVLMLVAGVAHFVIPKFYERLIPSQLGSPRAWVYGSGVAELACGALLAAPRTRRAGAWATLALLIGVYPGNLKMAIDAGMPHDGESWAAWLRLPIQVPLWRWAYRHTKG